MNEKIKWLREKMKMLDLEAMIVSNPVNVTYLTGFSAEGILLLTRKENIFVTDSRYIEQVNSILTINDDIVVYNNTDLSPEDKENLFVFCENIGFEENYITYAKYKSLIHQYKLNNLQETEQIIEKQRMIKDEMELLKIRKACDITDKCFEYLKGYIKIGMTEKQIAYEIEKFFRENGADGASFETIVASGKNSSKPHAIPTDKKIEDGDPITIDFGCKYQGYSSDMTRTIFAGHVPEQIKPVYDLVLKNNEQTLDEMKEGTNVRLLSKMVENDFKIHGYDLLHALGHGVGLEVHEMPYISSRQDSVLKEHMVVTNEPGIYIPGKFGVRIEDTVEITKYACIPLTKSDKGYIVVG